MDGRGGEVNEGGFSGYAGVEGKIGDLIEIMTSPAAGLPLHLKVVVRNRTSNGLDVEFLADTLQEKLELSLFRQFVLAAAGYTDA